MNFSLSIKKVDRVATYSGFEKYLNQLSKLKHVSKQKEVAFKANLGSVAHYFCEVTPDKDSIINTKEIKDSFTKIKSKEKIVISKPDKGSGVVILNKDGYNSKMIEIITDETKFKELGSVTDNLTTIKLKREFVKY